MTGQSGTPSVEEFEAILDRCYPSGFDQNTGTWHSWPDFARQLERELAEAQADAERERERANVAETKSAYQVTQSAIRRAKKAESALAAERARCRELEADARRFKYWAKNAAGEFIYDLTNHDYLLFQPKPPISWASIDLIRKAIDAATAREGDSHE